ncbi:hypothetical protein [Streptomyces omiyaensis]|uniref:Uncharacterized protein n=1 Tax=Streptomyces omiyaensis TaxID=68247 RepID=A0ABW7BU67_9ACTN|nr:hypothetical protein [Streptomyces omiyaensis]GGY38529.1 hypothetical protein GCM10010363_19160 [Streptomyces omiyaensis]
MRSARILFAATATAAALALTTPGAYALTAGDWDKDDSAHSQKRDHDKPHGGMHTGSGALSLIGGDDWSKDEHGKKEHHKSDKDHGKPHGGMHTGGGALTAVSGDDWSKEHDKGGKHEKDHDKPHGGMHTGSGALSLIGDDWSKDKHEKKDHDKPYGGMHTGAGALSAVNADDWGKPEQQKPEGYKHDKPKGGMHTGGGGLAGDSVSLSGALVLAAGAGAFVLYRRKKTAGASA